MQPKKLVIKRMNLPSKTLRFRDTRTVFPRCIFSTVANPSDDREAWKDFLSTIQQQRTGEVNPAVWDHVPHSLSAANELAAEITWKELTGSTVYAYRQAWGV